MAIAEQKRWFVACDTCNAYWTHNMQSRLRTFPTEDEAKAAVRASDAFVLTNDGQVLCEDCQPPFVDAAGGDFAHGGK